MSLRVLIAVTHLLGAGHLTRAAALARAFARAGHETTLISGGMPSRLVGDGGVALVQLPPVRTEGTAFASLLDGAGHPAGPDLMAARRDRLLEALASTRPDVVITELFPFGRRILAGEFTALLAAAHVQRPRPLVIASIRDILVAPTKPGRIAETRERLAAFYDAVLVHGDPALVPLEASWPVDAALRDRLHYTGYVDDGVPVAVAEPSGEVLVSGGSSAAALPLLRTALATARLAPERPWRLLAGPGVPEATFADFGRAASANVVVERARTDFRMLLAGAAVSVSQAGYNTAVDLLRTGTPAVLVPFEAGRETEQRLRADHLAAVGAARMLPEAELSAESLADAVARALAMPAARPQVRLDGASATVALVESLARRTRSPLPNPAAMPRIDWSPLDTALRRAADRGHRIAVWWRDDDAVAATPALERLLATARRYGVPLALAAVPARLEPSLGERLEPEPDIAVLVHGFTNANHAPSCEKKAEFGPHRPLDTLAAEAGAALAAARSALGERLRPVFVPPWNRLAPALVPRLPQVGFAGLSTFRDRASPEPVPGLVQVNTHLDPIDWHGSRSLRDPAALVAEAARAVAHRAAQAPGEAEPIGLLTHHLAHDDDIWGFCESLLERLSRNRDIHYPDVGELFLRQRPSIVIGSK